MRPDGNTRQGRHASKLRQSSINDHVNGQSGLLRLVVQRTELRLVVHDQADLGEQAIEPLHLLRGEENGFRGLIPERIVWGFLTTQLFGKEHHRSMAALGNRFSLPDLQVTPEDKSLLDVTHLTCIANSTSSPSPYVEGTAPSCRAE